MVSDGKVYEGPGNMIYEIKKINIYLIIIYKLSTQSLVLLGFFCSHRPSEKSKIVILCLQVSNGFGVSAYNPFGLYPEPGKPEENVEI